MLPFKRKLCQLAVEYEKHRKTTAFSSNRVRPRRKRQKHGSQPCRMLAVGKAMPHCSAGNPDSRSPALPRKQIASLQRQTQQYP
jgi:hypothetical protein